MTTAAVTPLSDPVLPGLSEPQRLGYIFVAPKKTFTDLNRSAKWWAPFLLLAIFSLGFVYVVGRQVGWKTTSENQMRLSPKQAANMDKMPPEQKAMIEKSFPYFSYAFSIIYLIIVAIIAAVYMATFNFGVGAEIKYSRAFAVVIYASLPTILRTLIAIAVMFSPGFDPAGFIMQNPAATNLGAFFDPEKSNALYLLGSSIDIFTLWWLALMGIGFACVSKVKQSTSMIIVFGWWALATLVRVGWAAMFG